MPDADANADLGALADSLRQVFPDLAPVAPLRVLGGGIRSLAIATATGIVFRVGKNGEAVAGHERELRLLPVLSASLPVAIPQPRWYAGPSERLPFGAIGYPALAGSIPQSGALGPQREARLAADLADFLLALHRVPLDSIATLGLPERTSSSAHLEALSADALPALRAELNRDEYDRVYRWWDALLADESLRQHEPRLIHADLWYENLLIDEDSGALVGVLDWEDAALGDPAQDLATQRHLGDSFAAKVLRGYCAAGLGRESGFAHRVRCWWELRELEGVAFAVCTNDEAELRDAIRKLRLGPILGRTRGRE